MTGVTRCALFLSLCFVPLWALSADLYLPKGFYATSLNGTQVSPHSERLSLTEGKQVVALRYINPFLFHKEFHELVVSRPFYLVFHAKAQGKYQVQAKLPTKLEDAKRYARRPVIDLIKDGKSVDFDTYIGDEALGALLSQ
ncbi:DUF2057 family protein [Ferrimonas gelatinilytica]|uniref:DUF2846 domain-containing protein n=1 Tax=Ferrimonas gelatinilytica TaxID=1255257 RepID=A0ABP9S6B2_9GAMM